MTSVGQVIVGLGPRLVLIVAACHPAVARADIPPDYDFKWANIADRNNPPIPDVGGGNSGLGSVPYAYRISRLEVTTQQWADFLNMAVSQGVNIDATGMRPGFWGASQSGGGGQFVVSSAMRPVIGVSWRAGAYYVNWLNNGKQSSWASCQSGAYDTSTFGTLPDGSFSDQLAHSPDAKFWIPTLDEWLKAAHYDPNRNGVGQGGWWNYCYQSNSAPVSGPPGVGQTSADWNPGGFGEFQVPLGAYTTSTSAYGLWDLSGGASEWTETYAIGLSGNPEGRRVDGSYAGGVTAWDHMHATGGDVPSHLGFEGFRIASQIPAPSAITIALCAALGISQRRRR